MEEVAGSGKQTHNATTGPVGVSSKLRGLLDNASAFRYHRTQLNAVQRRLYDALLAAVQMQLPTCEAPLECRSLLDGQLEKVWTAIDYDYSELFTVTAQKYTREGGNLLSVLISYSAEHPMLEELLSNIQAVANPLIASIAKEGEQSDFRKELLIVRWMVAHAHYSTASDNRSNIAGFFLDRKCACEGYTRAFQYLCNLVGLRSIFVSGDSAFSAKSATKLTAHCWNMVSMEGTWYHTDVTWCSASTCLHPSSKQRVYPHFFLNMNNSLLSKLHKVRHCFPLPMNSTNLTTAQSMQYNYYSASGLLVSLDDTPLKNGLASSNSETLNVFSSIVDSVCNLLIDAVSHGKDFVEFLIQQKGHRSFGAQTTEFRKVLMDQRFWSLVNNRLQSGRRLTSTIVPRGITGPKLAYPCVLVFFDVLSLTSPK